MTRYLLSLLIMLLLPTVAVLQFEKAFETPQPRRIKELDLLKLSPHLANNPAAQLRFYYQLEEAAEQNKDPQSLLYAKACILSAEARLDSTIGKDFVEKMTGFINQSMTTGNEILQTHLLVLFVDDLGFFHRKGAALSYRILADSIMQRMDPNDTPRPLFSLRHDLLTHLYEIGDLGRAKEIMDNSAGLQMHPIYELFYADLHSQILLKLGQYDSSAFYIMKAREMLGEETTGSYTKGWYGILEGNLAKIHYFKKEYHLAIPLLMNAVKVTNESQLFDNTAPFGLMLAKCYIETNELEKIGPLMPVITNAVYRQVKDEHYIDLYKLMLIMSDQQRSPARTLQLLDSIDLRKESLAFRNDLNLLTKSEMEDELRNYQRRQSIMDAKIRKQRVWRNLLWAALGGAVVISITVFYNKNKHFRLEQERSKQKQEQAELALTASREQLRLFTTALLEKSHQIELLENNLDTSKQHEALEHIRKNTILTEEDWANFRSLFEKAYPGFFSRVNNKLPNLTPAELRFIALVKLSFTTKEMASTLGVSPVSVRSIRSRLLKKLDLTENENLGEIVNSI